MLPKTHILWIDFCRLQRKCCGSLYLFWTLRIHLLLHWIEKYVCWNNPCSLCKIRYNDYNSDEKETCYGLSYTSKIRSKSDSLYKKLSINAEIFTRKRETCLRLGRRNIYQCQENSLCRCSKKIHYILRTSIKTKGQIFNKNMYKCIVWTLNYRHILL